MWWVVDATPWPLYPRERHPEHIIQNVGWVPGPVWSGAEISPAQVFDPWPVKPVAGRYTDWAIEELVRCFSTKLCRVTPHKILVLYYECAYCLETYLFSFAWRESLFPCGVKRHQSNWLFVIWQFLPRSIAARRFPQATGCIPLLWPIENITDLSGSIALPLCDSWDMVIVTLPAVNPVSVIVSPCQ